MVAPAADGMKDTRDSVADAGGLEQVVGLDREFEQRVQTGIGCEVEDGLRLLLAQNQGRRMCLVQTLEPILEQEPLAEIQRGWDLRKSHRFEKKFLTTAGKKFTLGENRGA